MRGWSSGFAERSGQDVAVDVLADRRARVGLPGVRRVVALQTGLEHRLRVAAASAGDRAVDDVATRVDVLVALDEFFQRGVLGAGRPPRKHFEVFAR
jgi:hypothetical protein